MQENSHIERSPIKWDLLTAGALSLGAALVRMPYLALIPVFEDEIAETVFALNIRLGEFMPLVDNDAYRGALFSYLLAAWLRVFGSTPIAPHIFIMILGALTVGLTFLLARALGLSRPWAAFVGLLMLANPYHILISSHYANSSYSFPYFGTLFLVALALAVKRESGSWLVAAGALLGLALQTNPVPAIMLPGVAVWFLVQRKPAISLRTRWPYLAAAALLLAYSPVIVYNLQTGLISLTAAKEQTYVWQWSSSLSAYAHNLVGLAQQLGRQVSGVLEGAEDLRTWLGLPFLFSAWAVTGLLYAAWRGISLPVLAVGSQVLIMPWLSNYYGAPNTTRFTNHLTPLMVVAMGVLARDAWALVRVRLRKPILGQVIVWPVGILLVAISLWPLTLLFSYYNHQIAAGQTNAPYFAFADEFMQQWRGEKVFLSESLTSFNPTLYFLAVNHVPYQGLVPIGRLLEYLTTGHETGRIILVLANDDLRRAREQADLIVWDSPAMQTAGKMGYGVYTIADAQKVRKPTFVFTDTTLGPTMRAVQASFADQLGVIGFEVKPDKVMPGGELIVNVHWKATAAMPETFTGFLHLVAPDGRLVAQDDHELGRGFYRTIVWQPGEVIREKYVLTLPKDAPLGEYALRVGAYSYPSLERLSVRSASTPAQDDMITLGTVRAGP